MREGDTLSERGHEVVAEITAARRKTIQQVVDVTDEPPEMGSCERCGDARWEGAPPQRPAVAERHGFNRLCIECSAVLVEYDCGPFGGGASA